MTICCVVVVDRMLFQHRGWLHRWLHFDNGVEKPPVFNRFFAGNGVRVPGGAR